MMETYKAIRKIVLTISFVLGGGIYIFWLIDGGLNGLFYKLRAGYKNPYSELYEMLYFCIVPFIFFVIFFKCISMIIEARIKDKRNKKVFEDERYSQALSEVEENNIQNKELWAKAFAKCGGDKEKQKSIYVELRRKELS